MYRKFIHTLEAWEKKKKHKPLMVIGARQIGKTWLLKHFCQETYGEYIYLNMEERSDLRSAFMGNMDPDTILRNLEMILGQSIDPETPLFFDEIQSCEQAVTALKYFCEDERDFRILSAGSLLGVKLNRFQTSFPVGKVEIENMFPMDFEEFLLASDESILHQGICDAYEHKKPLVAGAHTKALSLYHDYLFTGGMPEAVMDYLDHGKDIYKTDSKIQKNLQAAYLADMTKYVTSPQETAKIAETYQSIPRQLAKENPKFTYREVRPGGNRRDFSEPLEWLEASGMIYKIDKVVASELPLKGYAEHTSFKIYLSDVGMLRALCGIRYQDLLPEANHVYKGGIIENYVIQQLRMNHSEIYYFKPSEAMEIDALLEKEEGIIPIEIKAGRHRRSTSLRNYCDQYHPAYAIRLSENNFGMVDGLYSVPLYAAFCL